MKADDIVFLGSPGVGVFGVTAKDFPNVRIWAARARWESIRWVEGTLGSDPMLGRFGARTVPLEQDQTGHSRLFAEGSAGLRTWPE